MERQRLWISIAAIGVLTVACPSLGAPAPQTPGVGVASTFGAVAFAPERRPHGAAVVSSSPEATDSAKRLARRAYREPSLRPELEEATASTLVGAGPACSPPSPSDEPGAAETAAGCDERLVELQQVVDAVAASCREGCHSSPVARSLLTSLGRDLGVAWIVLVSPPSSVPGAERAASVQLLRVATGRFEPVVLGAKAGAGLEPTMWDDVVPILQSVIAATTRAERTSSTTAPGLVAKSPGAAEGVGKGPGSAAGTSRTTTNGAKGSEGDGTEDGDVRLLSSPWFWGGLGVLVAAGVTVFALSQSSLGETDTVRLEGRVSP